MAVEGNRGGAGPSPFSRPPQPRIAAAPMGGRPGSRAIGSSAGLDMIGTAKVPDAAREALERQRKSGAQWFFWIALLSSINAVLAIGGHQWRFILGLGTTQLIQEIAQESGGAGLKAGAISFAMIGFFVFLGTRAIRGYTGAFVAGIVVYALDGFIFLLAQDWVGVGFHAFAVVMIVRGYLAARQLASD
jgi:hypothetical protein